MDLSPLMFILVVSMGVGLLFPYENIEIGDDRALKGAWHGITLTKNQFGMTASLGTIICLNRLLSGEGKKAWAMAGAAVGMAFFVFSGGKTSPFSTGYLWLF